MICQKCRTPVRPDASLDDLNPASFKLLVDSAAVPEASTDGPRQARAVYPASGKERYERASREAPTPLSRRTVDRPGWDQGAAGETARPGGRENFGMSFVMLNDSQIARTSSKRRSTLERSNAADGADSESLAGGGSGGGDGGGGDNDPRGAPAAMPQKMEMAGRLFEILSSRSDIDHPICVDCTELLLSGLQTRLLHASKERDCYIQYLKEVNSDIPTDEDREQANRDLQQAQQEEQRAFAELEKLEQEKAALDGELEALETEFRGLDEDEQSFWRERNEFTTAHNTFQNERDRIHARLSHDARQLEFLQRTNVYNDTFCIGHDGNFGIINGLRLGRLPDIQVDWSEINAAWGQTCLLLATIAEKLQFTFKGYRLNPIASNSTIDRLECPPKAAGADHQPAPKPRVTTFELYCSGDVPLGLGFLHRHFDNAMVAFLDCLKQLGDFVEQSPAPAGGRRHIRGVKMPYEIRKDRIGDSSIKSGGFNQEDSWTKACKYTLTCCKYLLAHTSNISNLPVRE